MHRLLDSVLAQSYDQIEHIIVDDGSTDRTAEVIESYISKYEAVGKRLVYIYQNNGRAGSAVNRGLKAVTGAYLSWPDADDYYTSSDSILKCITTFKNLPKSYGIVRCDAILIDEDSQLELSKFSDTRPNAHREDLFEDCIMEREFWYTPGCYFTSMEVFDSVIRNREIFVNGDVQNWQMLLPILYRYKCYYIKEPLHYYLVRNNSYCHQPIEYELALKRSYIHEEIIGETLKRIEMPSTEFEKFGKVLQEKYILKRLILAFEYGRRDSFSEMYVDIKRNNPELLDAKIRMKNILFNQQKILQLIRFVRAPFI